MRKKVYRAVELFLLWVSVMGLIRWAAATWPSVAIWWGSRHAVVSFGALSLAYIVWWLRHSVGTDDRRRATAPRHISHERREALAKAMSPHEAQKVSIYYYTSIETTEFCSDLNRAIRGITGIDSKRWEAFFCSREEESLKVTGIRVDVGSTATEAQSLAIIALVKWFRKEGFTIGKPHVMPGQVLDQEHASSEHLPMSARLTIGTR